MLLSCVVFCPVLGKNVDMARREREVRGVSRREREVRGVSRREREVRGVSR